MTLIRATYRLITVMNSIMHTHTHTDGHRPAQTDTRADPRGVTVRVHLSSHWPPHAAAVCLALDQQLTGATKSTGRASSGQDSVWHVAHGMRHVAGKGVKSVSAKSPRRELFIYSIFNSLLPIVLCCAIDNTVTTLLAGHCD